MSFEIRAAVMDDFPPIVELLCGQMLEHELESSPVKIRAAASAALEEPRLGQFLVAVSERSEVIGVAYVAFLHSMEHGQTVPMLEELYVRPAWRGGGVGRALLRRAVAEFSSGTGRPMELEVDATHRRVEAFYQAEGFTRRDRTRWIFVPGTG